ncbi:MULTISPECIES: zinc ABC transporter substrate-binding protein [Sulfurimonas]|uniref:metal ABC transporter substrate-binding protein n=1 Tax=Sulfurimonas TaxID=202746 RepID=UPI0012641AEA|nr:zinc ABC transporter substrate-binding protein [Sulfurimonas indica]
MKKILLTLLLTSVLFASLKVDTTYATLGAVAKKIGGDAIEVTVLASPQYDPHFITPKPSLIAKLRRADLLIINGGGLEIGWLPPLLRNANNPKIRNGAKGFLDISHAIAMIEVPTSVSRAYGDVHAQGNPHYFTDPYNILLIAKAIEQKLIELDPKKEQFYSKNFEQFEKEWQAYLKSFDAKMTVCTTKKVIEYHELYDYFLKRYSIKSYGNIEPLPGIAPSSKHTVALINTIKENGIKKILQDVYHEQKTAKFIAAKTGVKVVVIPHDVGAVEESDTLEKFYDTIAKRICH